MMRCLCTASLMTFFVKKITILEVTKQSIWWVETSIFMLKITDRTVERRKWQSKWRTQSFSFVMGRLYNEAGTKFRCVLAPPDSTWATWWTFFLFRKKERINDKKKRRSFNKSNLLRVKSSDFWNRWQICHKRRLDCSFYREFLRVIESPIVCEIHDEVAKMLDNVIDNSMNVLSFRSIIWFSQRDS